MKHGITYEIKISKKRFGLPYPGAFYLYNDTPYLECSGWLAALTEKDIEYIINYWETKVWGLCDKIKIDDLKKNYKKYKKLITIKSIIE